MYLIFSNLKNSIISLSHREMEEFFTDLHCNSKTRLAIKDVKAIIFFCAEVNWGESEIPNMAINGQGCKFTPKTVDIVVK